MVLLEINDLAPHILLHIFSYLDHFDLCQIAPVCSYWRDIAYDTSLWKALTLPESLPEEQECHVQQLLHRSTRLQSLSVVSPQFRWSSLLECFDGLPRLKVLRLKKCKLASKDLEKIVHSCPLIEDLAIDSCNAIGKAGLLTLGRLKSLVNLVLYFAGEISDRLLAELIENCSQLQKVHICFGRETFKKPYELGNDEDDYMDVSKETYSGHLTSVSLVCVPGLSDNTLDYLSRVSTLKSLHLEGIKTLTPYALANFFQKSELPNLTDLKLCHCDLDDRVLHSIAAFCKTLKTLHLATSERSFVSDDAMNYVITSCRLLKHLIVYLIGPEGTFLDIIPQSLEKLRKLKVTLLYYHDRDVVDRAVETLSEKMQLKSRRATDMTDSVLFVAYRKITRNPYVFIF